MNRKEKGILIESADWEHSEKTGNDYLKVRTSIGNMTCFDKDAIPYVLQSVGKTCDLELAISKTGYKSITKCYAVVSNTTDKQAEVLLQSPSPASNSRDESTIRQVAFKGAIELICYEKFHAPDTKLQDLIKELVDDFERIIQGENNDRT